MVIVDVDGSGFIADSVKVKSDGLVWRLVAMRCPVCIHQMKLVNSYNGFIMITAPWMLSFCCYCYQDIRP